MVRKILLSLVGVLLFGMSAFAQAKKVEGTVVDETGTPIIGASIVVVGTGVGDVTSPDGTFVLRNIPTSASELEISYLGYVSQIIKIASNVSVKLLPDTQQIETVVVTGMTKTDKRLFTGAADHLAAEDVKLAGMPDISRGLEGRSAGVSVQNVSGTFGSAPKIRIRGATSIFGSSKPLWVVDGVIVEDVADVDADALASGDAATLISSAIAGLNAEDIESFNVLKDGSATSIYGARAMAGVIVITTKKGRAGESRINYSGEFTYRAIPDYSDFNIMNSQDQMSVYQEMYQKGWLNNATVANASSSGIYGKMWEQVNNGTLLNTEAARNEYFRQNAEYQNTDWFKELFNNTIMHTHSVSMSSGTEKSQYYASLSAMSDPGWTDSSEVERYTASMNATYKILDNLSLVMISNASIRNQLAPGTLASSTDVVSGEVKRDFDINPYSYALNSSRTMKADETYTSNYAPFNIHDELENNYIDLNVADMKFQGELKYNPIEGLDLSVLGAVKYSSATQEHNITDFANQALAYRAMGTTVIRDANPFLYTDPDIDFSVPITVLPEGGIYKRTDNSMLSYDFRASAAYNTVIDQNHIINAYAGMEINKSDRHETWFRGWGLQYSMGMIPFYAYEVFKQGQEQGSDYFGLSNYASRNVAMFGNLTYSWQGKYTLNGTLRYEGTNRMGKSRQARWLPTWNVAGSWNVDQEQFFESISSVMNSLQLKASYSLTADRGPAWVTNSSAVITSFNPWRPSTGDNESGMELDGLENSELTYEKKHELNFGASMGFLQGRLNLAADWYRRDNYDLIGVVTTQGIGGEISKYGNVAAMKSSGWELTFSSVNVKTNDFKWTSDFIYAHSFNEITSLMSKSTSIEMVNGYGFGAEGYPVGAIFSYDFQGLNENGIPQVINESGEVTTTDINFQERDDQSHLVYSGSSDPTDYGSFGNTFSYKNFNLNFFITYSMGNVVRLDPVFAAAYSDLSATPYEFADRWTTSGDENLTDIPVIASRRQSAADRQLSYAYNAYNYSTARIADGDFIRMKEISLSYDFPKDKIEKLRFNSLSLKLQATNLFLIYSDKALNGQDPEFFNTGGVAVPVPKQFTLSLRIGL